MYCSSSFVYRIIEKDRNAISCSDSNGQTAKIRDHSIVSFQLLRSNIWIINDSYMDIMHLMHLKYRKRQSRIPTYGHCRYVRMKRIFYVIYCASHYCSSTPKISLSEVGSFLVTVAFFAIFLS